MVQEVNALVEELEEGDDLKGLARESNVSKDAFDNAEVKKSGYETTSTHLEQA